MCLFYRKRGEVMEPSKENMIQYAQMRIRELKSDLADPVFTRWIKELKIDLKRWEEQLKELEGK